MPLSQTANARDGSYHFFFFGGERFVLLVFFLLNINDTVLSLTAITHITLETINQCESLI